MNKSPAGTVFNIQHYAVHDGPGIRVTVFLKGCPLRCWWCHNPEGQNKNPDPVGNNNRSPQSLVKTFGKTMTVQEVMGEITKDIIFFDDSGGGVTFSGGEPLLQPHFLKALFISCKDKDIHTALDTCGYAPSEVLTSVMDYVDLVLYDLKIIDDTRHRQYTGVSNRMILDNLKLLSDSGKQMVIRFPVIPDITDTSKNTEQIIEFLKGLKGILHISLLPYHRTAAGKYEQLKKPNKMIAIKPPTAQHLQRIKAKLSQTGYQVKIGR